jgi:predicted metal-dependent phosphoesterase TrpH
VTRILWTALTVIVYATSGIAQEQPVKLAITSPQARQRLTGTVQVSMNANVPEGKAVPSIVYVGLGGSTWQKMERSGQTQEWKAVVDTTLLPNGQQSLSVITENKRVRADINVVLENPPQVFFADLHSHTGYSDGTLLPSVAHEYARDVAKLDVFCLTDHLEYVDDAEWTDIREVAWDANVDGEFVVIPGLEWTKKWGHLNIYDPKTRHWPEDPSAFYQAAADAGVVTKFNHPGDGTQSHSGLAYSEVGDQTVQMMEVRHAKEEAAYIRALDASWHIAAEGSSDTHSANWGNVRSWTGIIAPGLSKRNILDALVKRHVYSTLDRNCKLTFEMNGAIMGDIIEEPVQEINVFVQVCDPDDSGDATVELFQDGNVIDTHPRGGDWRVKLTPEPGKHYYFVKATQADGNMLWSAPIWVTVTGN